MNKPKLSVIVPVYNSYKYLDKLFNCFISQTLEKQKYEVIFVNDGSTDDSRSKILNFISDKNNFYLINQNNMKQAEARNNGIKHASGKYVLFVDADDYIADDYFKTMAINSHEYDYINSNITKRFPNKVLKKEYPILYYKKFSNSRELIIDFLDFGLEVDNGVWAKAYNLTFLKKNNIFFENSNFFEDSLFNLRVFINADIKNIKYLNYSGYFLNKHANTTTNMLHPELDSLVKSYINKSCQITKPLNLNNYVYKSFYNRQMIYVLHHHIKFDNYINSKKISKKIKLFDFFNNNLSIKYTFSIVLIKFFFPLYLLMYKINYFIKYRRKM